MPISTSRIIHFVVVAVGLLTGANFCLAQNGPAAEIQKALAEAANIGKQDFSAIDKGGMFDKVLPIEDKRDLAVIGIVGLDSPIEDGLNGFDQAITRQKRKSGRKFGKFGNTPKLEDLRSLSLEESDIKNLKGCSVGRCSLRLSTAMIERFRDEVDWSAKNPEAAVNRLYRQMLVEYVADYLKRGNAALIEYRDKRIPIRLNEELNSMHDRLIWIREFAPEFAGYLEDFPNVELSNVENEIRWAVVKVALERVLIITHISTYTKKTNGMSQILVVSKQIYANHRFDASLGLTVLASFPKERPNFTYCLYTSTARVGALKGVLGKLVRGTAEDNALDTLRIVLKDTKKYAQTPSLAETDPPLPEDGGILKWLQGPIILLLGIVGVSGIAGLMAFRLRRNGNGAGAIEK